MTEKHAPGVVVAVAIHRKVIFEKAYGFSDVARRISTTVDTHFEIGSVTKQFTAAAIMQLLAAGKLRLDDRLGQYVPQYRAGRDITLRQLLWQISGVPNYTDGADILKVATTEQPTLKNILARVENRRLLFTPGTRWAYSNTNYILLGHVLEVVSHESYQQYIRNHIFSVAGMPHSGFISDEPNMHDIARGYMPSGGSTVTSPRAFGGWGGAAGAVVSTASDMLEWDYALLSGKVVARRYVSLMRTTGHLASGKPTGYGMGWYIDKLPHGNISIWHNGGTFGFSADNETYPNQDEVIIVLDNNIGADAEDIAGEIFRNTHQ